MTIGELHNVPAFNSPILSDWPQDATRVLVHRFATVAERDAFGTWPTGRLAFTTDTETLWLRGSGGWVILSETAKAWNVGMNDAGVTSPWDRAGSTYMRASGWCTIETNLRCTGPGAIPGAGAGPLTFFLPFPAALNSADGRFVVAYYNAGTTDAGYYVGGVWPPGPDQLGFAMLQPNAGFSAAKLTPITSAAPFVWVAGCTIRVQGTYRMASRYT